MTFLKTMENLSSKKQRVSQKPTIRTIASRNSNQPETRINATKETRTNAMELIATMKRPFAPTISFVDIQMPNVATLEIQKEQMPTMPIAMIRTATMTATNNNMHCNYQPTKTIKTTSNAATII
jgi:chemotaxis response regulator CheB